MRVTGWIRRLIVTCGLAAALLPAGAASQRTGIGSTLTFGVVNASPARMPIAPWWQSTFVVVREDGSFETRPVADVVDPAQAAVAMPEAVTLEAPGAVEGLLRAD